MYIHVLMHGNDGLIHYFVFQFISNSNETLMIDYSKEDDRDATLTTDDDRESSDSSFDNELKFDLIKKAPSLQILVTDKASNQMTPAYQCQSCFQTNNFNATMLKAILSQPFCSFT